MWEEYRGIHWPVPSGATMSDDQVRALLESVRETAYLMRSPANARRLLDAMERLEAGQGEEHGLIAD